MSVLPVMEKLLEGVEVEWKTLGEVADIYGGLTGKSKSDFDDGNVKYISYKNIFQNIAVNPNLPETVKVNDGEKQNKVLLGDVLFTGSSEIADEAGMSSAVTVEFEGDVYLNSFSFGVRFKSGVTLIPDFSKYLFRSSELRKEIAKTASGVTRFNISKERFRKIQIPIPPLNIQAEIVRILDAFTTYTAELTAELNARKKQYNHYRDQLLSFSDTEVEWKKLGDLTNIFSSSRVHKNQWTTSGVRFLRTSDVISIFNGVKNSRNDAFISEELFENLSSKSGRLEADDILVTGGGTIGIPYIVPNSDPLYFKDADLLCIKKMKLLNSKFLYHFFLTTTFRSYLKSISHNSTIGHYTISQIKKTPVPVPSIEEQARIVAILDKFDALTASISEGLPREIQLRQQQYEYYRDRLLSFPRPAEAL